MWKTADLLEHVLVVESLYSLQISTWAHPAIQTRISRGERGAQAAFVTTSRTDFKLQCSLIIVFVVVMPHTVLKLVSVGVW
jgi:hypothetical protein